MAWMIAGADGVEGEHAGENLSELIWVLFYIFKLIWVLFYIII